ncbi:hypothetical protein Pan44_29610 [Caulifigura coniformis]|uniref:Lipocalin-like domain-containing protein n=1 Tax=Caulifigura coniformis TaxID=2527983 RepID=A0A517SFL6_9PLAN|nr:hypothetical protein [Caulifigura coniformis]QDT54921.1 hypothetical protein Pan44_29610 [Caulifigura coniformis]
MTRAASPLPRRAGFSLLASLGVVSVVGLSLGTNPPDRAPAAVATAEKSLPTDADIRAMIPGRWKTESNGTRVVDNRADGTASMDVTFDFVASLLYGAKMKLELKWIVEDGKLVYTIQSGTPADSANSIIKTYGSQATYRIGSIEPDRMHLIRVIDPTETYTWTRVP